MRGKISLQLHTCDEAQVQDYTEMISRQATCREGLVHEILSWMLEWKFEMGID